MSNEMEVILEALVNETYKIIKNKEFYEELFMDSDSVSNLNGFAPRAFSLFQQALANDIMASIFRLLDPVESCGDRNLTLILLKNKLADDNVTLDDSSNLDDIKTNFKDYRNKILSHNDLSRVIAPDESNEFIFPWSAVVEFCEKAPMLINIAKRKYFSTEVSFNIRKNPANELLRAISAG